MQLKQQNDLNDVAVSEMYCIFIVILCLFVCFGSIQFLGEIGRMRLMNYLTDLKKIEKRVSTVILN